MVWQRLNVVSLECFGTFHSNWSATWTSVRPNWWLPRQSTAWRCATWKASQRKSTPSAVPSPWEPGSKASGRRATMGTRTSPTSQWNLTACPVSLRSYVHPRWPSCGSELVPPPLTGMSVFQWCRCPSRRNAVTAQRRRQTLTPLLHTKPRPPRLRLRCAPVPPPLPLPPSTTFCSALPAPTSPPLPPHPVLEVRRWRAPAALTAPIWCTVLDTPHLSWVHAADAVELPHRTATRREVCAGTTVDACGA